MSTRIWYQSMAPIRSLTHYQAALQSHATAICGTDVTVTFNGVSEERYHGRMPADVLKYSYAKHVLQGEAITFAQRAERDGFDAVILGSFSEPFLPEIRSLLDIPVATLAESAMLIACSLAEQFALVTLAPPNVKRLRGVVARHAMGRRVSGIYALNTPVDEHDLDRAFETPEAVMADFREVAERAVLAGADVVIPAEGVLNEVLFANGVRSVSDATVLDCVGATLLYTELLVSLKRRGGMGVGRRWSYARPPCDLLAELNDGA